MFIGLGGQGARSLAELRKVMESRSRDSARLKQAGVKWEFLSIDSGGDVWRDHRQWNYFGKDLSLEPHEMLKLQSTGLGANINSLALSPDIAPWIGSTDHILEFIGGDTGMGVPGANQRRRFGRLLFATAADAVRQAVVFNKVGTMLQSAKHTCWFHVFASLAGGTGSGCIVDLITMLRQEFPDANPVGGFPIYLYLFLTDSDGSGVDVGYFYQNQFAALRDLNALMAGRLRTVLVGSQKQGAAFTGGTPINAAVISTNLNSGNRQVPLSAQIKITAEAVFERIFTFDTGSLGTAQQQSLTFEDLLGTFAGEPLRNAERAYRFAALGMRKWEVPNEKLKELIGTELASSGLAQMLYNNWQPSNGFANMARAAEEGLLSSVTEQLYQTVRTRLIRREAGDREREALRQQLADLEKGAKRNRLNLEDIETEVSRYVRDEFGGAGLQKYIAGFTVARGGVADSAVVELDRKLTKAWLDSTAPISLKEVLDSIDQLSARLREEATLAVDTISKDTRDQRRSKRKLEWQKLTTLSELFRRDALIAAHFRDLEVSELCNFDQKAQSEDADFLKAVIARLAALRASYESAFSVMNDLLARFTQESKTIESELLNLQTQPGANQYEFNKESLDEFRVYLRKDRDSQNSSSFQMRSVLAGEENGLTLQRFRGREEQLREQLDEELRNAGIDSAERFHLQLTSSNAVRPVLGESLLDRLERKFAGNPRTLDHAAREFLELAASCCANTPQMQPSVVLQDGVPEMPRRILLIGVPRGAYGATMKQAFKNAIPAGTSYIFDTYEHEEPSQIRLLVCDYWMAARFAKVAHGLSDRYASSARNNGMHVRYFSNIDREGENDKRPDLFLPDPKTQRLNLHAQLWIGCNMSPPLVKEDENGVFLFERTETGGRMPERIGTDIQSTVTGADISLMQRVSGLIGHSINSLSSTEAASLKEALVQVESEKARQYGETSQEFIAWGKIRKEIHRLTGV